MKRILALSFLALVLMFPKLQSASPLTALRASAQGSCTVWHPGCPPPPPPSCPPNCGH